MRGGVYSTSSGGERLDLDEKILPQYFKEAGYKTAAYGKWHNGMQYPYHPNGRGFDDFYGFCSGHWANYINAMMDKNGAITKGDGFIIDDLTNHALKFIDENQDNPFFLYVPYNTPHEPMMMPDEWWDKKKDAPIDSLNHYEEEDITFTRGIMALCENIDWNVGRIMNRLKERGLEENTIVIYLSDNGPNSWRWNGGMRGKKGSTDEGGVRSPFIIQWKGTIPTNQTITQIASATDILPTLADLCGIAFEPTKTLDGKSLKPLIFDNTMNWPDRTIINYWGKRVSIRNQQFRLDDKDRLYDMYADPGQKKEVTDQFPIVYQSLKDAKSHFNSNIVTELPEVDNRNFTIGHPDYIYNQLPARDAVATGTIQRSNRWPNSSYFTHWTSTSDEIQWETEVLAEGDFEAFIYYTCAPENVGAKLTLTFLDDSLRFQIKEPQDTSAINLQYDRFDRHVSVPKNFMCINIGDMHLKKGVGQLKLKAREIPGNEVMDFRLLMLNRINHEL